MWVRSLDPRAVIVGVAVLVLLGCLIGLGPSRVEPVTVVVGVWLVGLVATLPATGPGRATLAGGAAVGWVTHGPRMHLHHVKGHALLDAIGRAESPAWTYGGAWNALHDLVGFALGWPLEAPGWVGTGLAVVTVGWGAEAASRRWGAAAGWAAGLTLVALPLMWAMAPGPHRVGLATAALVTAIAGLSREDRAGDVLAAAALATLSLSRPETVLPAVVGVALVGVSRDRTALAWAAAPVLARAVQLTITVATQGAGQGMPWRTSVPSHPERWVGVRDAALVLTDPTRLPWIGGLGLVAGLAFLDPPRRRTAGAVAALGLAAIQVQVLQPLPPDRLRLQLAGTVLLAGLGGACWGAVVSKWPRRMARPAAAGLGLGLGLGAAASATPFQPPYPWHVEHTLLVDLPPREAPILLADHPGRDRVVRWLARRQAGWRLHTGPLPAGALVWIGTLDQVDTARPVPWEDLDPVQAVQISGYDRGAEILPGLPDPLRLGLFRTTRPIPALGPWHVSPDPSADAP